MGRLGDDGGDGCTRAWMYLMPLSRSLKSESADGKSHVAHCHHDFKHEESLR